MWCALGSDPHFHTADMLGGHMACTLWGLFLAPVMQAVWIFKAASPHPCDRSRRDSRTLKFWGERSGLFYREGELWQRSLRAEYMYGQVEELGWALREDSSLAFQCLPKHVRGTRDEQLCCQNGYCGGNY